MILKSRSIPFVKDKVTKSLCSQRVKFFVKLFFKKVCRVQGQRPANKRYSYKTLKNFY
jgi:hypothetical protein